MLNVNNLFLSQIDLLKENDIQTTVPFFGLVHTYHLITSFHIAYTARMMFSHSQYLYL